MTSYLALPEAIREMVATTMTFHWFGFDDPRLKVDFGPRRDDPKLHGIVILTDATGIIQVGIPCGRISDDEIDYEGCVQFWVAGCEAYNKLTQEERDIEWRARWPLARLVELGTAMGAGGILTIADVDSRIASLSGMGEASAKEPKS